MLGSVQFNLIYFEVRLGPPSVGAYTRTPSHQPLVFGRKGTDHLP